MEKKFKNGKVYSFFKRNLYYVLMVVCVIAIGTMIIIAATANREEPAAVTPPVDTPVVVTPDDNTPVVIPDDGDDEPSTPVDVTPVALVFTMPVEEYTVARGFSDLELSYNKTLNCWQVHKGCDFCATAGSAVVAIESGTVTKVETNVLDGTVIEILHNDQYTSVYKSTADAVVKAGDTVAKGQKLAVVSDSAAAEYNEGVHVHLELLKNGAHIDPMSELPEALK